MILADSFHNSFVENFQEPSLEVYSGGDTNVMVVSELMYSMRSVITFNVPVPRGF